VLNKIVPHPDAPQMNHLPVIIKGTPLQTECLADAESGHSYYKPSGFVDILKKGGDVSTDTH
jgi:hypothetical protein